MIRLLIGDGNVLLRAGIRELLDHAFGLEAVEEASTVARFLELLRLGVWDLCVLDVSLPERGGLDVVRHLRKSHSKTALIYLSSFSDRRYAAAAFKAGAQGFMLKDCQQGELETAAQQALEGRHYISPTLVGELLDAPRQDRRSHEILSQRELQIFRKLAIGTPLVGISRDLSISPKSVSTYRSRILEKTRCRNNAEITQYAVREGLI
ncbi:MAG TPA: response regulator transcription factor [Steroidobacteraceae bacterium]|nr:response regulator transcription factor [Steroidobacteraceae bacterium]